MRFAPTSFRPAFGRGLSIFIAVMAVAGLAAFIVTNDWWALARYGWGFLLIASVGVALFWLPMLDIAESEITVRNVFSTVHIPWANIERIDTKYALTLYTTGGKVTVWASPAPSRYASQVAGSADAQLAARVSGTNPRPGDLLSTPSGAAAYLIRAHWDDLRENDLLGDPEASTVRRDLHWVTIATLCGLTVATVVGATL